MADQENSSVHRGSFGVLFIGVGLLMTAVEAFVAGGFHPGVYVLGALLVLVGCTQRIVDVLCSPDRKQRASSSSAPQDADSPR